jgi:glycosyltransferase involved in cell wall biosynthesis
VSLVSILIPCYNAERWVGQAIESALSQTVPQKEIICFNDGSTDDTLNVLRSFGGRIRVESGPNRGGNPARNRLLRLAQGDWIQYLDADDYLRAEKIQQQLESIPEGATPDILFGPVATEQSLPGGESVLSDEPLPEEEDIWKLFFAWELPQTGGLLWKREALEEVGGWKEDQTVCQENELYLRMLMAGKRFFRSTGGAVYRIWSEETVCRRDPLKTFRTKMELIERASCWLREQGQLTEDRRRAVAEARLECARAVWAYDREFACELAGQVKAAFPAFAPSAGLAFPVLYRWAYRWFGFSGAERIAGWKRQITGKSRAM